MGEKASSQISPERFYNHAACSRTLRSSQRSGIAWIYRRPRPSAPFSFILSGDPPKRSIPPGEFPKAPEIPRKRGVRSKNSRACFFGSGVSALPEKGPCSSSGKKAGRPQKYRAQSTELHAPVCAEGVGGSRKGGVQRTNKIHFFMPRALWPHARPGTLSSRGRGSNTFSAA